MARALRLTVAVNRAAATRLRPSFADSIRNTKAGEKKRVYAAVLAEVTKSQKTMLAALAERYPA